MPQSLSNQPEPTYSRNITNWLKVLDCFLMIPAAPVLLYGAFLMIVGLYNSMPEIFLCGGGLFLLIAPGFVLMVGYFKHTRGRLAAKWLAPLWIGTAVYNSILLLPWLYWLAAVYQEAPAKKEAVGYFLLLHSVVLAYVALIAAALRAYKYDKLRKSYGFL